MPAIVTIPLTRVYLNEIKLDLRFEKTYKENCSQKLQHRTVFILQDA